MLFLVSLTAPGGVLRLTVLLVEDVILLVSVGLHLLVDPPVVVGDVQLVELTLELSVLLPC